MLSWSQTPEVVVWRCSVEKVFLGISRNSQETTCASLFFNNVAGLRPKACNFIKKETLAQVFSCEFYEISNNTFFTEHLRWLLLRLCLRIDSVSKQNNKKSKDIFKFVEGLIEEVPNFKYWRL